MKSQTLRSKMIVGGMVLVLVPIVVIGLFAAWKSSTSIKDIYGGQTVQIAKSLTGTVQIFLKEEMSLASSMAVEKSVVDAARKVGQGGVASAGPEIEAASAYLSRVQKRIGENYEGFTLLGPDGVVFADGEGGVNKGINASEREAVKIAKTTGKIGIGSPVRSKRTGNIIFQVCAPIIDSQGQYHGAILNLIKIGFLTEQINSVKVGKTGYAYMVDKAGTIIVHPNKDFLLSLNFLAKEELKELGNQMIAQKTGNLDYFFQGETRHAGFAPVEMTGWSIGVVQNHSELAAITNALTLFIALSGLIFLVLTAAIILIAARKLTEPINRVVTGLSESAGQVAS
ncbi:MAG: Cache 3/Cache 2 fusion domain-containing protein, partial [Deltaproteobacteria bacterium]|nr:Cache 3/Cache 2 fusion domain-containing protein [Deltaproteobacteria bacterium]